MGLLARGRGPPELTPLLGRLLGNRIRAQEPIALGVSGREDRGRPLRLTPRINLARGSGPGRSHPVIPGLPSRSRDPTVFLIREGLGLKGPLPYFLRGGASHGDLLVPLGPVLAPLPRGVGGDGSGQEVAIVSPVLLPGPGQLPVPVRLRNPNLGPAVHLTVLLVRSNGQGHAHPDGWWGTPPLVRILTASGANPQIWLSMLPKPAGLPSLQSPPWSRGAVGHPGVASPPPQGAVWSWAS